MREILAKYYREYHEIIYHVIMLAGIIVGLVKFKKLSSSSRIFLLLLFITPIVELTSFYCAIKFRNNNIIYNPFTIVEFSFIAIAFFVETRLKSLIPMFISLLLFATLNGIFFQPFFLSLNTNTILLSSLFIITWFFVFLSLYFKNSDTEPLRNFSFFWVGAGWMLFSVTSIISFGFMKLYTKHGIWDDVSTVTRQISNYILYLSFIVSFLSPQKSLNDIVANK